MGLFASISCIPSAQSISNTTSQPFQRIRRGICIPFFHFLKVKGWLCRWTLTKTSSSSQMEIMTLTEKYIAGASVDCKDCLTCDSLLNEKTSICGRGSLINLHEFRSGKLIKCKNGLNSLPILTRHSIFIKRLLVRYG